MKYHLCFSSRLSEGRAKAQTVCSVPVPRPWAVIVFNKTPFSISQGPRCAARSQFVSWTHAQGVMTAHRRRRESILCEQPTDSEILAVLGVHKDERSSARVLPEHPRQASTSFSPNVRESQIQRGGREALLEQTRQNAASAAPGPLPGGGNFCGYASMLSLDTQLSLSVPGMTAIRANDDDV